MNECEMYAPNYLRAQKDTQLHLIADMIEKQMQTIHNLRQQLDLIDRTYAITSHWEKHIDMLVKEALEKVKTK
jgi:hypothetical protein